MKWALLSEWRYEVGYCRLSGGMKWALLAEWRYEVGVAG